tara:strand:+ start:2415 stop:2693 length:279 start_codon:yes stop_codon:yes gene_type:complete
MSKKEEVKVNKITDEQLSTVNEMQAKLNDAVYRLGMLDLQKETVRRGFQDNSKEMEDIKKSLEEEYGAINIDLKTGEYTLVDKEEDVKEDAK